MPRVLIKPKLFSFSVIRYRQVEQGQSGDIQLGIIRLILFKKYVC